MSDATLLRLEAKFMEANDQWDAATARTAAAEKEEERTAAEVSRLFDSIMKTRATTLAGLLVKMRVRERWNTYEEASELAILKSLIADMKAMTKPDEGTQR